MKAILFFSILFTMLPLTACAYMPLRYSADRIGGIVVDAETDQPIEGAVVIAHWNVTKMHLALGDIGYPSGRNLVWLEAVTDKEGKYLIPAWGPKFVSPLESMSGRDSHLAIFKSGYWLKPLSDIEPDTLAKWYILSMVDDKKLVDHTFSTRFEIAVSRVARSTHVVPSHRKSVWNGRTIRIKKFILGEERRYVDETGRPVLDDWGKPVIKTVTEDDLYDQIRWETPRTPNTCKEILKERSRFSAEYIIKEKLNIFFERIERECIGEEKAK